MSRNFVERPTGKLLIINCCVGLGLLVAYRDGYRGLDLLCLAIASVVIFNAAGAVGIWVGRKSSPARPNRFLGPLWITIGILGLIYLLYYLFPTK